MVEQQGMLFSPDLEADIKPSLPEPNTPWSKEPAQAQAKAQAQSQDATTGAKSAADGKAEPEQGAEPAPQEDKTGGIVIHPPRRNSSMVYGNALVDENAEFDPLAPLAARLRPRNIDEYIGQSHLLGEGKPLRQALERGRCYSMIFWGPPGVGKTTLAFLIARSVDATLEQISAVSAGIKDIREAITRAQERKRHGRRTILFVDEVHRFNKAQQDAFLPYIENGTITFIGATTENPSFQVNQALLSRARIFVLKALTAEELNKLIDWALTSERGLKHERLVFDDKVRQALIDLAGGDARHLLTTLEMLADDAAPLADGRKIITYAMVGAVAGRRIIKYDKGGDAFYDLISAFHKSVRGSNPDAALYWYARILEAGGDPLYVARRILAIATEDVGLADPQAMQVALNAWDIFTRVGEAEGERAIAEAAVYMALAPKSNHLYTAFHQARADASSLPSFEVPLYLRNAPTKLMESLGYHRGYRYAHDYPGAYAAGECFMPEELDGRRYYEPSDRGFEGVLGQTLNYLRYQDAQAPLEMRRYPPQHAEMMQSNLQCYHPELFAEQQLAAPTAETQAAFSGTTRGMQTNQGGGMQNTHGNNRPQDGVQQPPLGREHPYQAPMAGAVNAQPHPQSHSRAQSQDMQGQQGMEQQPMQQQPQHNAGMPSGSMPWNGPDDY